LEELKEETKQFKEQRMEENKAKAAKERS